MLGSLLSAQNFLVSVAHGNWLNHQAPCAIIYWSHQ